MGLRGLGAGLALACLLALPAGAASDRVRFLEGAEALATLSPDQADTPVEGYLSADEVEAIVTAVPPPPVAGTPAAKAEDELYRYLYRGTGAQRWQLAREDDAALYPRFTAQLGFRPDRATAPALVALLNRVAADTLAVADKAKVRLPRLRPFQVEALARVCGQAAPPRPDAAARGTSYPSGHAAAGWSTALVLAEVAPAGAQAIIARAVSYGQSRVVCGLHFPGDVEAGHFVGSAVIAKAFEKPAFRRDLACARREVEAVMRGEKAADLPACTLSP